MSPTVELNYELLTSKIDSFHEEMIEIKRDLKKLMEIVQKIVILEERVLQSNMTITSIKTDLVNLDNRLRNVETKEPSKTITHQWVLDIFKWAVLLVCASLARKVGLF